MRKLNFYFLHFLYLGFIALVSMTGCSSSNDTVQNIVIGHVAPLTGLSAPLGKDMEQGAQMAFDELNTQNIMIAGKSVHFKLQGEDDASDPKQGTAVAQKLVDVRDLKGVIGHLNSGTTIPASRIYYDAGIPQISPGATNPKYTRQGFSTTFRIVADDAQLGAVLGRFAVNDLKGKKVAIIDDRTAYGQGLAQEFKKSILLAQAKVVAQQYTTDKATDFSAILTAIKSKDPDIIFFGGMDAVGGPLLRQMTQQNIRAKLIGGDGLCTGDLPGLAKGVLGKNRVYCAEAGGINASGKAKLEAFKNAFQKRFNHEVLLYAAYSYDAAYAMVEAMKAADSWEPIDYLPKLKTLEYDGVTGHIAFNDNGDIRDGKVSIYTYQNQKRMLVVVR